MTMETSGATSCGDIRSPPLDAQAERPRGAVSSLRCSTLPVMSRPTVSVVIPVFNGLPYLASELGFFVEVAVTVQGVTLSQIHPVLDGRNRR